MSDIYYERFLARIYDDSPYFGQAKHREPDKFHSFYFENLKDKERRVLEFGSGTGTLTIALARAGYKLDSVDISPYMHEVLSDKLTRESPQVAANVKQIVADATTYQGPELYDSIVMPEGILIAIPDKELQLELLRSCHRNLAPGGRIYTDFFQPRYKLIYHGTTEEFTRFQTRDGDNYLLAMRFTNDEYSQIQDWNAVYTKEEPGGEPEVTEVDVRFRYLFYSEAWLMLEKCGFKIIDFDVEYADRRGFAVIAEKV